MMLSDLLRKWLMRLLSVLILVLLDDALRPHFGENVRRTVEHGGLNPCSAG